MAADSLGMASTPASDAATLGVRRKLPVGAAAGGQPAKLAKTAPGSSIAKAVVAKVPSGAKAVSTAPAVAPKTAVQRPPVQKAIQKMGAQRVVAKTLAPPKTSSATASSALSAKAPVAKAPVAKAVASTALIAKAPVAKQPGARPPVPKKPAAEQTVAKPPMAKQPVAKQLAAKAPVAKAPVAKAPVAKAPVAKLSMPKQVAVKVPAAKEGVETDQPADLSPPADGGESVSEQPPDAPENGAPKRSDSWKEFSDVDPLYAMLGELGTKKVVTADGEIDEDALEGYLNRLTQPGVIANTRKDWIEVWATMGIPIDKQDQVLRHLVTIALESDIADTVPEILAELVKGHRVKVKMVEEAIATIFECGCDEQGCLANFFFRIFPKSPTSEWGWSRVGWSWQQWWSTVDRILKALDPSSAFECLRSLLTTIEVESGAYLPHQAIWDEKRLGIVRQALCTYGELAEDELPAAIDIVLT